MALSKCSLKRKIEDEGRIFQEKWENMYFFTTVNDKVTCLICNQVLSTLKEYNLRRHYDTMHKEKYSNLEGKLRNNKVTQLKAELQRQQNFFRVADKSSEAAVQASFTLSELIAKSSKPFTDGDFVKTCLLKASEIICPEKQQLFKNISLSANTVAERINELAGDVGCQLKDLSKHFAAYSIAIDESTDITDKAQLAIFVRGVNEEFHAVEELLELVPMKGKTTAHEIFSALVTLINKYELPWEKLVSFASDGAPAMIGEKNGVAAKLKNKLSELKVQIPLYTVHCIIHQEALCAKSLKMDHVMDVVIKTVNFIRARGLNHREFNQLLEEMQSEYQEIIYHTEVRWLSRGSVLKRFFELLEEIKVFMLKKDKNVEKFSDKLWVSDLAFLVDLTEHLNSLNKELQGKDKLIIDMFDNIKAFKVKLHLWENQLKSGNLVHFLRLKSVRKFSSECLEDYATKISQLREEFDCRFNDFKKLEPEFILFSLPLKADIESAPDYLQMELINLQCNTQLCDKFNEVRLQEFYSYLPKDKFPQLRRLALRMIAMFGSTYVCEQFFSLMKNNKSTTRSRLTDEHLKSIMKVASSNISPRINLLSKAKRSQISSNSKC